MNTDAPTETKGIHLVLKKLPPSLRGHIVAIIGEFIGTLSFIFFAFAGTQTANVASNTNTGTTVITKTVQKNPAQLLYISLSFGFSLAVNAWVFFRISGGLFNPAVTVGMVLIGAITILRGALLFVTQIAGAIVGAYLVQALFTGELNVDTTLSATTTVAQGVIIEMILTAMLCFTIFMLAAEKHAGNFIAPVGIGLALFIAELVGVFWTGGSLNPARSLAPPIVSGSFHHTQWVYWVGPIAGSILAVIIFKIIKGLEYETANPDPESFAPTGPVHTTVSNTDSKHGRDKDLESAYYDSSKEGDSSIGGRVNGMNPTGAPPIPGLQNIGAMNVNTEGPRQDNATFPISSNRVNPQTETLRSGMAPGQNVAMQTLPPQNYATQGMLMEDKQWNNTHTANARENTFLARAT